MVLILGIYGKMGVGKDYIAKKIMQHLIAKGKSVLIMSFADQMKVDCIIKDKIDFDKAYGEKDMYTRSILQNYGMEYREKYNPDYWVNYMETWIRVYNKKGIECIIIPDVRFINEIQMIKKYGGVVMKIIAPKRNMMRLQQEGNISASQHISENAAEKFADFDYVIQNDGTEYDTDNELIIDEIVNDYFLLQNI